MKKVFIKTYGWCDILQESGNYALIKTPHNSKTCSNVTGYKIVKTELF